MTEGDHVATGGLTAGEAARRLGVAVTTLRSWHQRYGLGPSGFVPGRHRRYTDEDMRRLTLMHQLASGGLPAAQAAVTALAADPRQPLPEVGPPPDRQAARGLARAALRLDPATAVDLVDTSVGARGTVATWDDLIRPAFALLVARQQAGQSLVDAEHLLSGCISTVFAGVRRTAPTPAPVLLACAAEEQHTLALEALAAALAEVGHGCRLLGARVPVPALERAVRRAGPLVLVLWSQDAVTADPTPLRTALACRPRPAVVMAAGPGWAAAELPAGVVRPADLREALRRTLAVLRAPSPA